MTQIECNRCHRKEYVEAVDEDPKTPPQALIILVDGVEVAKFQDLCEPCQNAVKGYIQSLSKPMEKMSPDRKKKGVRELLEEAAAAKTGEGILQNGTGARKEGVHHHPPPTVVTKPAR